MRRMIDAIFLVRVFWLLRSFFRSNFIQCPCLGMIAHHEFFAQRYQYCDTSRFVRIIFIRHSIFHEHIFDVFCLLCAGSNKMDAGLAQSEQNCSHSTRPQPRSLRKRSKAALSDGKQESSTSAESERSHDLRRSSPLHPAQQASASAGGRMYASL